MFFPLNSSPTQANHLAQLNDWLNLQYIWSSGLSIPTVTFLVPSEGLGKIQG